jgi:hypothetical protein
MSRTGDQPTLKDKDSHAVQALTHPSRSDDLEQSRSRLRSHTLVDAADVTSSVNTLKLDNWLGPKEVTIATSVASRPFAIKIRPMRGLLWRASNVYQRPPR